LSYGPRAPPPPGVQKFEKALYKGIIGFRSSTFCGRAQHEVVLKVWAIV